MSLFVIADLSAPRGTPLELQLMVPQVMVPVVPIIQEKEQTFEMFRNLKFKYDWVLKPLRYHTEDDLIGSLEKSIKKMLSEHPTRAREKSDSGTEPISKFVSSSNFVGKFLLQVPGNVYDQNAIAALE